MKKDIHPDYHPVVFRDIGADYSFLTRSTATSAQTVKWEDGNEYPLINIDIRAMPCFFVAVFLVQML